MSLIVSTLQTQLQNAAQQAFIASFLDSTPEQGDERMRMAQEFAKTFAQIAAPAIDAYIKSATITGGVVNTAGSPSAQVGSITGPPTIM